MTLENPTKTAQHEISGASNLNLGPFVPGGIPGIFFKSGMYAYVEGKRVIEVRHFNELQRAEARQMDRHVLDWHVLDPDHLEVRQILPHDIAETALVEIERRLVDEIWDGMDGGEELR